MGPQWGLTLHNLYRGRAPRWVDVTFTVPGLRGSITERYDRLSQNDMACWRANTSPPAVMYSAVPLPGEMLTRWMNVKAYIVSCRSREQAKELRRVKPK